MLIETALEEAVETAGKIIISNTWLQLAPEPHKGSKLGAKRSLRNHRARASRCVPWVETWGQNEADEYREFTRAMKQPEGSKNC